MRDTLPYTDNIENSIKFIIQESNKDDDTKTKLIFKKMYINKKRRSF